MMILVCLYFAAGIAFSSAAVQLEGRYSPENPSIGRLENKYYLNIYAYTPKGWDNKTIDESILDINLDRLEAAIRPGNTSAEETLLTFPDFAFTSTEVTNNRSLAVLLSQRVPTVGSETVPCLIASTDPKDRVVQRLSCLARQYFVYITAGLLEGVPCTEGESCREDGMKVYSTAVVFDKEGYLVAKHRKYNLINEQAFDKPETLEPATFTLHSGFTLGIFMSHDLLFAEPANSYFANGVHHFVHFAATINTMPFEFSIVTVWGWHLLNRDKRIGLVMPTYQNPMKGYAGEAVMWPSGGHMLSYSPSVDVLGITFSSMSENYKSEHEKSRKNVPIVSEEADFTEFASVPVPHSSLETNEVSVCHGEDGFCCTLSYRMIRRADEMFYQLVAFDGNRTAKDGTVLFPEQTCGLVACGSADKMSCGASLDATNYTQEVSFTEISLIGSFSSNKVIPSTMKGDSYFPTSNTEMTVLPNGNRYDVKLTIDGGMRLIKTFALTSTDFTKSGAKHFSTPIILVAILLYISTNFF